ncbi:hypothetical protein N7451_008666 [Penicillium sp. IBT 35674x]|nr:hypothetical protein N7451_008666 [Penicillium sp. IBT 35674x]
MSVSNETFFTYPYIPADCIGPHAAALPGWEEILHPMAFILRTTAAEWGNRESAAARAATEPAATPQNESLIRTYRPSLARIEAGYAMIYGNEKPNWVVAPGH